MAVRVAEDEQGVALGTQSYWLARLKGPAFQAPEDRVDATDEFQVGWWIAKAQWFDLKQQSPRMYKLLPEEITLLCNAMVRLPDMDFEKTKYTGARKQYFLSEMVHNRILDSAGDV